MQEGAPAASFIESYNKEVYQDESFRSEESDDEDDDDEEEEEEDEHDDDDEDDSFDDSHQAERRSSKADETKQIEEMAREESKNLCFWKWMVLIVLLVMFATVTTGTYVFLHNGEVASTTQSYKIFTRTVKDASDRQFHAVLLAMSSMAQTVTAAGISTGGTFPFVRVPMFEVPASQTRELSGVEMFAWAPLVTESQRNQWSAYVVAEQGWYNESKDIMFGQNDSGILTQTSYDTNSTIRDYIWRGVQGGGNEVVPPPGPFAPIWHCSPPPFSPSFINYNMLSEEFIHEMLPVLIQARDGLMSAVDPTLSRLAGLAVDPVAHDAFHKQYVTFINGESAFDHPHSAHLQPVFDELNGVDSKLVGFLASVVPWDRHLANLLPDGVSGITAILKNTCNQSFSYLLNGHRAAYLGVGDLHDTAYDDTEVVIPFLSYANNETASIPGHCVYSLTLYNSDAYESSSSSSHIAVICTVVIAVVFILMAGAFFMYDRFVRRRNLKVITAAARSNAIISSLFPTQVRERLFAEKEDQKAGANANAAPKSKLKSMINSGNFLEANSDDDDENDFMYKSKPIADLFPETTILFADIAGFTAWSSVREPSQVFILLETLFRAFDDVAKKRRVFKVETVGDCYVAVTGLPDPRKDHAVAMARFARDCMFRMRSLTKKLEVTLGPDTGDLAMRMGMHSGPVTAGVLRGERSRFQLFGDTMNTAARMEHNGLRDKIQLSQETADLLIAAGKTNWLSQREDVIHAKGKGEMQTYWLELSTRGDSSSVQDTTSSSAGSEADAENSIIPDHAQAMGGMYDSKTIRLIEWNVDVLLRLLKQIVARRRACPLPASEMAAPNEARFTSKNGLSTLDEVKEIITLPKFKEAKFHEDPDCVSLDPAVVHQLHDYVCNLAAIYRDNPFHNFEHASHVTMSVVKLLSRIVAPHDDLEDADESAHGKNAASTLHDHTYGITSDPLTQFSCVLSALIHDADHTGVPNAQLVKEQSEIAKQYKDKSVAEQNSVDLAWNLLMDKDYTDLRRSIYETDSELKRFRQLVVNSVMATDIVDKELKTLRNLRWDRAFSQVTQSMDNRESVNRKATIVIEHLIQASDVAHTMQHWHIYRKWNERFFIECYQAYQDGRAEKNPAENWYEGEIGFFDFYIIPLAKKLKDCGVFGVSSDEYLNYAIKNRQEWETRGREMVDAMIELVNSKMSNRIAAPPQPAIHPVLDEASARLA